MSPIRAIAISFGAFGCTNVPFYVAWFGFMGRASKTSQQRHRKEFERTKIHTHTHTHTNNALKTYIRKTTANGGNKGKHHHHQSSGLPSVCRSCSSADVCQEATGASFLHTHTRTHRYSHQAVAKHQRHHCTPSTKTKKKGERNPNR